MDDKERLRLAKEALDSGSYDKETIEYIFPELKESEDERIRQFLIQEVTETSDEIMSYRNMNKKDVLAWLEKQGEQKPIDPDTLIQQRVDALNDIIADQKPTNKVEPKFKVGDWTVSNLDRKARQISEVHFDEYNSYYVIDGKSVNLEEYDRLHHLWTIQDAKNGDILSDGYSIVIFRGIGNEKWNDVIDYHIGLFTNSQRLVVQKSLSHWGRINEVTLYPATKEQRDLLFKKMKEVGYEWDAEKKELKKIEQTPTWSEEDEKVIHCLEYTVKHFYEDEDTIKWCCDWLKSLKEKVLPQPKQEWSEEDEKMRIKVLKYISTRCNVFEYEEVECWLKSLKDRVQLKQEWSEEDEYYRNIILYCLNNESVGKEDKENAIKWLKSLRPQNTWKPSDKQLNNLLDVLSFDNCTLKRRELLESLYNDLKKLMEE